MIIISYIRTPGYTIETKTNISKIRSEKSMLKFGHYVTLAGILLVVFAMGAFIWICIGALP